MALVAASCGCALLIVSLAGAATAVPNDSTTTTLVTISGDFAFSGAVITGPGLSKPRTLNAYQSAVYMQSWLGGLYSGAPVTHQNPPAALPVYEVDVTGNWGGTIETRSTFYASDGHRVWIAFPSLPPITKTPGTHPAVIRGWFVALPRVRQAFAGTAKLVETGGTQSVPTSTTTTTAPVSADARSGGSDIGLGIAIALAAAAVAGGTLWLVRRNTGRRVRPNS
jgi:hypothetical protein